MPVARLWGRREADISSVGGSSGGGVYGGGGGGGGDDAIGLIIPIRKISLHRSSVVSVIIVPDRHHAEPARRARNDDHNASEHAANSGTEPRQGRQCTLGFL